MKTIKETKRLIAIFLTVAFMMPTLYSCSKENKPNVLDYSSFESEAQTIINGIDLVTNAENNPISKNILEDGFTQEIVDEYAILLGYNPGDFSAESLENVLIKQAEGKTYTELMEEYNLSAFSKLALQNIKNGNVYENINDYQEFINLNENEKVIVSLSNTFIKSYLEINKSNRPHSIQEATGALVGLLIGGALCGLLCAIGGTILGAIIGGSSKQ